MSVASSASAPVSGRVMPTLTVLSAARPGPAAARPARAATPRTRAAFDQPPCSAILLIIGPPSVLSSLCDASGRFVPRISVVAVTIYPADRSEGLASPLAEQRPAGRAPPSGQPTAARKIRM